MTSIVQNLISEEIYVGYGYDALYCSPKEVQRVKEVMNEIALELKASNE